MDVDLTAAYVRSHGVPAEIARLDWLLTGNAPAADIAEAATAGEHPYGGWPASWSGDTPSIDATCLRLRDLADLGMLGCPAARRAVRWLVASQLPDGRWQEESRHAPPWAATINPAAEWYLTAHAGVCVALAGGDGPIPDAALRAARRLTSEVSEAGTLPSFPATHWLAAGLCWRAGDHATADRLLARMSWPDPAMSVSAWSWGGAVLARTGVPESHPARQAVAEVLAEQARTDGSWTCDDAAQHPVLVTLDALAALLVTPTAAV